ncbi:hypothetical protein Scep_011390 [Stephania cephalantha]|uniref:Uncharacterized protein n=1 Tax=Stephania cephalantha TaxID=152367 RepID=A0AAP0JCV8_9MAGN
MALQRCADHSNSGSSNYSSPVPVIGLYVAGANLVCLLLIALDMYAGFRDRKRWLPCRLFSLNSLTLTLIAIATKLPVDLTTAMPSAQDQLSKLTGTIFICICMGFFMPSLGSGTESECMSNMASLSILAITVFANICIQMHTGLVQLYHSEHIIILCCMILMLTTLWKDALDLDYDKRFSNDHIKEYFMSKGRGSLLRRLKVCFLYSYESNPQLRRCRKNISPATCALCSICIVVLLKVILQSLVSKDLLFCQDVSDYGWSMWTIVLSQIVAILVGGSGTIIRVLAMAKHLEKIIELQGDHISLLRGIIGFSAGIISHLIVSFIEVVGVVIGAISLIIAYIWLTEPGRCFRRARVCSYRALFEICKPKCEDEDEEVSKEYKGLRSDEGQLLDDWTIRKCGKDMKRLIDESMAIVPNHLIQLLRRTPPSTQEYSLATFLSNRHEICSNSIIVLAKIATLSIPSPQSRCILGSSNEVFKILEYIDLRTCLAYIKERSQMARLLWSNMQFYNSVFEEPKTCAIPSQMQVDEAIETIKKLHRGLEQLFVDMLNEHLAQLPGVILKEINESSPEDMEKRLRKALEVVSKIQQLEGLIQWSFPVGASITSLITEASMFGEDAKTLESNGNAIAIIDANTDEIPIIENQNNKPLEGASNACNSTPGSVAEGNVSASVSLAMEDDELIIEIE